MVIFLWSNHWQLKLASAFCFPLNISLLTSNVSQETHSMSVLAHKLTYRWWHPWVNFNRFQTVCLHQWTWYRLWDQASSKWHTPV